MAKIKEGKGITLVALIITIIVLLILAMVSIRLVMNGGIIGRAERGTQAYKESEIQEQIKLAYAEWQTAQWTGDAGDATTFIQGRLRISLNDNGLTVIESNGIFVAKLSNKKQYIYDSKAGVMLNEVPVSAYPTATAGTVRTENSKYISNGKTAVIPAGYTVSEVSTEQSIDNGLVIKKDGNEWVWIPVSNGDFAVMFGTASDDGWIMSETTDIKTKYKSLGGRISDPKGSISRVNPGDASSYREPDTVVASVTLYDNVEANWTAAGFTSFLGMAEGLRNDYKAMMDSVKKNGGFYIGRYELSSAGTKKNQASLTDTNWYNLYKKCKDIDSTGVETRMIWGCQWDQVCKFISTSGDQVNLTDSRSYGNYSNSTSPANEGNYSQEQKQNTGSNEAWKTNNIYDIAGNCWEWTQEAVGTFGRANRGGSYDNYGVNSPVTYRGGDSPTDSYNYFSSRPVLYVI